MSRAVFETLLCFYVCVRGTSLISALSKSPPSLWRLKGLSRWGGDCWTHTDLE